MSGNDIALVPTGRASDADADARRRDVHRLFWRPGRGPRRVHSTTVPSAGSSPATVGVRGLAVPVTVGVRGLARPRLTRAMVRGTAGGGGRAMGALTAPREAMNVALGLTVPAIGQRLPRHGA